MSSLVASAEENVGDWLQLPSGHKLRGVKWSTDSDRGGGILAV
jgi:hypothetical protein